MERRGTFVRIEKGLSGDEWNGLALCVTLDGLTRNTGKGKVAVKRGIPLLGAKNAPGKSL